MLEGLNALVSSMEMRYYEIYVNDKKLVVTRNVSYPEVLMQAAGVDPNENQLCFVYGDEEVPIRVGDIIVMGPSLKLRSRPCS